MDGYDEIPTTDHPQLNRQITNLILNRKDIRIILSSRKNTYDFDSESNTSKHEGFEIYYLNELSLNDIETYFESLGGVTRFSDFERELKRVNFLDVIKNPFYLKTIVELFLSEHTLPDSKGKLMYHCIERMTSWDDKRSTTIIYFDRYEVTRVIKKVAFAMEIMCRNTISNTDLRQILDNQEYSNLKYFGGFKKEDGKNDLWKFDHNNFQEFLAARALCHLGFDQILKIISFDPDYTVLNPSWLNTMSYLLSEIESKETLDKILLWLKTHNSHFLVNADPIRVQEDLRFEVFKNIFIEYEKNDQFLYSNHFTNEQLVAFVQDIDDVFIFLIEKYKTSNVVKAKINALGLLGHLNYSKNYDDFQTLFDNLIAGVNNQRDLINGVLLHHIVSCLSYTKMLKENQIEYIIDKIYQIQSYEVISSAVKIIVQSRYVDKYLNYLIKAYKYQPNDKVIDIELNYNLEIAFSKIYSRDGIINLLNQLNDIEWCDENEYSLDFFSKIMENVYNLYKEDESILIDIVKTINNPELQESHKYQIPLLNFLIALVKEI
ncbi:MAG: hypothetical protein IPL23_12880 [Saprospiraceae bacterium]|nr:hypothetical protein [Saprospiraceae bacterium]